MKLIIGKNLENDHQFRVDLPILLRSRLLGVANSGGGKSYLLRKIIETAYGKVQIIVLDPEDDFATLREKFDFVLVGKGGDIVAEIRTAPMLAHKLLSTKADAIINLYELEPEERKEFVGAFLEAMVNAPKELWGNCIIILDEAHDFAPEKAKKSPSIRAVASMISKGRKRGFCLIPATQRLSKLSKDIAAECQNKIIGLGNLEIDRKRSAEELGFVDKEKTLTLRDLDAGEFYAVGPAFDRGVTKIKISEVETTHLEPGMSFKKHAKPSATASVKRILESMKELEKEAEEELESKEDFEKKIKSLQRELKEAQRTPKIETKVEKIVDPKAVDKAVRLFKKEFAKEAVKYVKDMKKSVDGILKALGEVKVDSALTEVSTHYIPTAILPEPRRQPKEPVHFNGKSEPVTESEGRTYGKCDKAILKFLVNREDRNFSKAQVSTWIKYSIKSSGFQNSLSNLASAGLIMRHGDRLQINPEAIHHATEILGGDIREPDTNPLDAWMGKLGKCERSIFGVVKDNPDSSLSKEELASYSGYSINSSGFQNALSALSSLKLITRNGDGTIAMNNELLEV